MTTFNRFIALGDSMTEGMCDEIIDGKFRGWADRVADTLAKDNLDFSYINLAIRGKLLHQVIDDQIPEAAKFVTGPETLVSFHAGANDVLRPNYQADVAYAKYEKGVSDLAKTGATLIVFTVVDRVEGEGKTAKLWHERFSSFNVNVRTVAHKYGATIIEADDAKWLADLRFLAVDRLHLNSDGHWRLSQAVLERLGKEFDPAWRIPLPPAPIKSKLRATSEKTLWIITFVLPWIWRRIRGKSSGDGRSAKYETPIAWKKF
ncbi:MAG: SGNH/GDSL hydrolase family protein [Candidatus Nanopelagicaceae bacterium]